MSEPAEGASVLDAPPTDVQVAETSAPRGRIIGVDLARGIALIGMAATHMLAVQDRQTGHLTTVGWLFAGRASALFAVLAGVSLALVSGGGTPRRGRARLRVSSTIATRAVLIGLVGLWLAGTGTHVAVILAYYAVLFVLALPFLGLRMPILAVLAIGWALLSPVVSHLWRQHVGGGPNGQVTFASIGEDPVAALRELVVLGYYPVLTWLTYLLAGLAVGRANLRSARTALQLLVLGVVLAAGAWLVSALLLNGGAADSLLAPGPSAAGATWWDLASSEGRGTTPTDSWAWLAVAAPHTGTPFDLIGTTGSAMAVLGLCLLVVRLRVLRWLSHPVAAAGSMTLTLYTVHAFALSQPWGEWDDVGYYLTHVVLALVFATWWLHVFRRGPMEWIVHRIAADVGDLVAPPDPPVPPKRAIVEDRPRPDWNF
jgi:uncharacterized membrane protein